MTSIIIPLDISCATFRSPLTADTRQSWLQTESPAQGRFPASLPSIHDLLRPYYVSSVCLCLFDITTFPRPLALLSSTTSHVIVLAPAQPPHIDSTPVLDQERWNEGTYRSSSLPILHLEVVTSHQRAQARARDVLLQDPGAHADAGAGQLGRRGKGRRLGVEEDNVAVRARARGGTGAGVVGAIESALNLRYTSRWRIPLVTAAL